MARRTVARKGITPVVAIVLLLMMTVAAAGAAYTWFSQMQQRIQSEATTQLQTELQVKDLRCNARPKNTVVLALSNTGSTEIDSSDVDLFIRGSGGHLNATVTGLDWSGAGFSEPGGFGEVTIDLANADTGSTFLVAGSFYQVEADFINADYTLQAGGCLAESP
ncbi:MAG: archaellin/type IV pilin N-terminal domain-containing protein [Candidatus Nanohaloarchaea archaeon]|nr:archaellin/type IV pilin N-terminal domain-containing protein [Candidatus Nanohaloarchaea archaeon]